MKTGAIDKQINNYLEFLTTKQKEAVLIVMKTFAEEQEKYNHWEDEIFVIEMDSRSASLENGSAKGYTWEEVKQKAHTAAKPQK